MILKMPTATNGSFEPNLVNAPDNWPYALPHLYAANVVSDQAQPKVELVGFWQGEYRLAETQIHPSLEGASASARDLFAAGVVKYLMQDGEIVEENINVQITGDWPRKWKFNLIRDVGVFLCYLQILLRSRDKIEQAQRLKESIRKRFEIQVSQASNLNMR
jgi:hypothetical protein